MSQSQSEPGSQPRSGVYAWDERDARSIASNTPSYSGALFAHSVHRAPDPAPVNRRPSTTARIASALMTRIRPRPRLQEVRG
jgi:hypothetical protein